MAQWLRTQTQEPESLIRFNDGTLGKVFNLSVPQFPHL